MHFFKEIEEIDNKKIASVCKSYIDNYCQFDSWIAEINKLTVDQLYLVLKKAIIFCVVDDNTANNIAHIATLKDKDDADKYGEFMAKRKEYAILVDKLSALEFAVTAYKDFAIPGEDDEYCRDKLGLELGKAHKRLRNFKKQF